MLQNVISGHHLGGQGNWGNCGPRCPIPPDNRLKPKGTKNKEPKPNVAYRASQKKLVSKFSSRYILRLPFEPLWANYNFDTNANWEPNSSNLGNVGFPLRGARIGVRGVRLMNITIIPRLPKVGGKCRESSDFHSRRKRDWTSNHNSLGRHSSNQPGMQLWVWRHRGYETNRWVWRSNQESRWPRKMYSPSPNPDQTKCNQKSRSARKDITE